MLSDTSLSKHTDTKLFWIVVCSTILIVNAALLLDKVVLAALPFGLMVALSAIHNIKRLYYLFFFLLPFSIEVELPGGFATDLPSEPFMIFLTGLCILLIAKNIHTINKNIFLHPISLLLYLHLSWILVTMVFSTHQFISLKFFLAKIWYVVPFFIMPQILLRGESDYRKLFKFLGIGVFIAITYVLLRHAQEGFTFASSNTVVRPIFRNHVNYAVMLLLFLPFLTYLTWSSRRYRFLKYGALIIMLVAIYLTYTRAAQISVVIAIAVLIMLRLQLAKYAIGLALIAVILLVTHLSTDNSYLDYAPEFENAIAHKKFDNLIEATAKMQDVSTVERFYRWVAGAYMVSEKPLVGYGPSTFYSEYKPHTVTSYKTYVSDNPEKSGIHNYFLMTAVEQGIPGLIIFFVLIATVILYGERGMRQAKSKKARYLIAAATVAFILTNVVLLINDLLEADKVGPLFFLNMAIIVYWTSQTKESQ
jgi:O-antigen ligase